MSIWKMLIFLIQSGVGALWNGKSCKDVLSDYATASVCAWSSILTPEWADRHGYKKHKCYIRGVIVDGAVSPKSLMKREADVDRQL